MEPNTKPSYVCAPIVYAPIIRILRLILFTAGIVSIFWFFFSVIGVLIGALVFLLTRDANWRVHGLVLSFSAATSGFAAHTGTAVEPLLLGLRTGPVILAVPRSSDAAPEQERSGWRSPSRARGRVGLGPQ